MPSGYGILQNFKASHPDLPYLSPHASSFVISSPVARSSISASWPGYGFSDTWWYSAQNSGYMEVYNHSVDHDHDSIHGPLWDPDLFTNVAVGGYIDGNFNGKADFTRINRHDESYIEIVHSATYILNKIGVWPDLFAYPYGQASDYMRFTYFPNFGSEHGTYAAFTTNNGYATRGGDRFYIPRMVHKSAWHASGELLTNVLNGAP